MKTLAQVISDEGECLRWEHCVLQNIKTFDYVVIGCIGDIGPNLSSLQDRGAYLFELAPRMTDFNVLHNRLLDHIFSNPQFNDAGTFVMVDSDETIEGVLPRWDTDKYPHGANLLYDYHYPFKNTRWISDRAFLGRTQPTVLGEYHYHYSTLGAVHVSELFTMVHHRNYHGRKYNVFGEIDYDLYESKMSWVQCVVEAYCGAGKLEPDVMEMIERSYKMILSCTVPDNVLDDYHTLYRFNYLWMRWNLESTLGMTDRAMDTARELVDMEQRVGVVLEYITAGRVNPTHYRDRYLSIKTGALQFGGVIDYRKLWGDSANSLPTQKM